MLDRKDFEIYDDDRGVRIMLPGNPSVCPLAEDRKDHPDHLFEYECLHNGQHVKGRYMCTKYNRGY